MGHITITRMIKAPIETVFGYVDEHTNTTKYMKGLTKWAPTTDVVHGKDAEFEVVMKAGPTNLRSIVHITAWAENKTIAWKSREGFRQTGKWAFREKGDDTEVVFDMDYEFGGGIAGRMLGKAAETPVRWNLEHSVDALKEQTEKLKPRAGKAAPAKAGSASKTPASSGSSGAGARSPTRMASAKSTTTRVASKTAGSNDGKGTARASRSSSAKTTGSRSGSSGRATGSRRSGTPREG